MLRNDSCEISNPYTPKDILKKIRSFAFDHKYMVFAFFAPMLIISLCFICVGMLFKNGTSILILDANAQYVRFFEQLWSILRGKESFFYTFQRALGGEFFGYYTYYLASPFSLLIVFFPKNMIVEAMTLIAILKTGFSGLAFSFLLYKTRPVNSIGFGMFSVMYALCAYAVAYQSNYMWMDALIWLPLITLGIESMVNENKFKLYIISLAIAIWSNYYIGYMLCIFTLLYFIFFLAFHSKSERNIRGETYHTIKSIIRFVVYTIVALLMAGGVLVCTIYSLSFGKIGLFDPSVLKPEFYAKPHEIISKLFIGTFGSFRSYPEGLPHLYAGTLMVVLLPAFFISKKIRVREKIGFGILFGLFFTSLSISTLELFWHGLSKPIWLSFRYSFIFSFVMLLMAYRAYEEIFKFKFKYFIITSGVIASLLIALIFTVHPTQYVKGEATKINLGTFTAWITALFLIAFLVIFFFIKKKPHKTRMLSLILCGVVCTEALVSAILCYKDQFTDSGWTSRSTYYNIQSNADIVSSFFKKHDKGFYRAESYSYDETNDPLIFNTRGVSEFVSTFNAKSKDFLYCLGFNAGTQSSLYRYNDSIKDMEQHQSNNIWLPSRFLNDSLLGIKYIYLKSDESLPEGLDEYYQKIAELENGYVIYENKYALSIAYAVNDRLRDVTIESAINHYGKTELKELHYNRNLFNKYLTENMIESPDDFKYISHKKVEGAISELKGGELKISSFSDTYFKGTLLAKENQFVFTTIPYDKMWQVYVDGERVDTFTCVDAMLAFDVSEGEHEIEIKYVPMQWYYGIGISLIGIVIFLTFCFFEAKRKYKRDEEL